MSTNFGDIGLTLDQENAPCAAGAIVHLAEQGFFDNTNCHRETNSPNLQEDFASNRFRSSACSPASVGG